MFERAIICSPEPIKIHSGGTYWAKFESTCWPRWNDSNRYASCRSTLVSTATPFSFWVLCFQVSLPLEQHPRPTSILMPSDSVKTRPSTPWVWTAPTPLKPASLHVHQIMFPGEVFADQATHPDLRYWITSFHHILTHITLYNIWYNI